MRLRNFINPFSNELNFCYENDEDGVYFTIRRFEQFIYTLEKKIAEDNENILKELEDEDEDVVRSILNQYDVQNSLHYFNDTILKSFIVSIYSYFEHKLKQISEISEKYLQPSKNIKNFKNGVSDIEKYNSFLCSEIIPDLISLDLDFQKIKKWKELRRLIVHYNSIIDGSNLDLSTYNSINDEYGVIKITDNKDILDLLNQIEIYLKAVITLINDKYKLVVYSQI